MLDAYMPVYIGEVLRKITHLKAQARGAYFSLAMHYWDHGKIKDDDDLLFTISACERKSVWKKLRPSLAKLYQIKDGFWIDVDADLRRQNLKEYKQKLSEAGKKSQQNRAKKPSENNQVCEPKNTLPISQPIDLQGNTSSQAEPRLQQSTSTTTSDSTFINTTISDTTTTSLNSKVDVFEKPVIDKNNVIKKVFEMFGNNPNHFAAPILNLIELGCDPELDIFPTIKSTLAKKPGFMPYNLNYFTQAIINAKEARLRPLPQPTFGKYKTSDHDNYMDRLKAEIQADKMKAEASHAA
jgi:uncharacterized protein YdaU (DUF1376 family)